jgi:hypothetical protein
MPAEPMTDRILLDMSLSPETWIFVVFAWDGTDVIAYDYMTAELTGSLVERVSKKIESDLAIFTHRVY